LCRNALSKGYVEEAQKKFADIFSDPAAGSDRRMLLAWLALKPTLVGPSVIDLRWRDAVNIAEILRPESEPNYFGFSDADIIESEAKRIRLNAVRDNPPSNAGFQETINAAQPSRPSSVRLIVAKLDASDEQLRSDFDAWLRETRAKLGHGIMASPPSVPAYQHPASSFDWQTLHQSRVLPYIDLTLWADLNDRTIPAQVFAWALWGDAGRTNTIYDTVKPKAEALMSEAAMRPLIAQAQASI
jgi:hypothetical protein